MVTDHKGTRIAPLQPEKATGRVGEIFSETLRQFGRVSNFSQVMAIAPGALEAWMTANRGVRMRYIEEDPEFLKVEQSVIIRTSSVNESEYCLIHNVELGEEAGLTSEQIRAIQSREFMADESLDDTMKLAVRWADAVTLMTAGDDDDLFEDMLDSFSQQQIVELTVLCCMWNFSNRFTDALHINPEPEGRRLTFHPQASKVS